MEEILNDKKDVLKSFKNNKKFQKRKKKKKNSTIILEKKNEDINQNKSKEKNYDKVSKKIESIQNQNNEIFWNNINLNNKKNINFIIPENLNRTEINNNIYNNNNNINIVNNNFLNFWHNYQKFCFLNFNNIIPFFNEYQKLKNINEQEIKFNELREIGLNYLSNIDNLNNYLLKCYKFRMNSLFKPYQFYNNNLLYNKNNQNIKFKNNLNNFDDFIITLKDKTNDPSIEKETKIKVTTSYKNLNNNNTNISKVVQKNIIDIKSIISGVEKRTVVRLSPIPSNYSSFDISKLLDKNLHIENGKNQRIYKALYVPLTKVIGRNIGFCFIMMVEPKYVITFYNTFNGICFNKKKCKKPCSVVFADIQGENFLKISEDPIRSPIIFKDVIKNSENKEEIKE